LESGAAVVVVVVVVVGLEGGADIVEGWVAFGVFVCAWRGAVLEGGVCLWFRQGELGLELDAALTAEAARVLARAGSR